MNETTPVPTKSNRPVAVRSEGPLGWLRDEIDRLFDDFPLGRPARSLFNFPVQAGDARPALELVESERGYRLTMELPGIEEKDIDIELAEGVLTISGEKREERETKEAGCLISERSYGAFRRQIALPADVDADTLEAKVKNGVLSIEMKKDESATQRTRKIAIH